MSVFNWTPDPGLSRDSELVLHEARFGDGYMQRTAAGINNEKQTYNLTFTRMEGEIDTIDDFLRSNSGGQSFDYVTKRGATIKVICRKWSVNYVSAHVQKLTCTFERVYE